ncbi:MAG: endolytic transglycosylase MltG [Elusimicrobia bacterium]|nr:endolytic transglycosylase MltG [Elusimicrobiota bacterium]
MKMRKLSIGFFLLALLLLYFFWPGEKTKVAIEQGISASMVAEILEDNSVILSSTWFKILVKITGTGKKIMPGEHEFRKYMSAEQALWILTHSTYMDNVKVMLPEGWRIEQMAERLHANNVTDKTRFTDIAKRGRFEGYLFPSTYYFKKNMPAEEVIKVLKAEFERQTESLFANQSAPLNLSRRQVVTIASIVEREAVVPSERPLITAVYLNRLRKNMLLEADPTVQYALGHWKKNISRKDLKTDSPYNTYKYAGLPPGPICNPGYESIHAVFNPAKFDALYFVSDRKGRHVFNVNYQEHSKAKTRIEAEIKAAGN